MTAVCSASDTKRSLADCKPSFASFRTGVKYKSRRVVVVFEGRDAAGKGGAIRATTRTGESPRVPQLGPAKSKTPRRGKVLVLTEPAQPGPRLYLPLAHFHA
jgi:polyphosphate kinase 2 (PPK2 family)